MTILTDNQKAALNYRDHIALTANAGSGKTFVLSRRYIEIAFNENISLRNIAAITFTDKASGELYRKIADEVTKRLDEAVERKDKIKLERIRRQLVSANISTIHSFCIDILKDFPMEAQLDANFIPIDKNTSDEIIQLSIEEIIKSSLVNKIREQEVKYLIRVFASKKLFSEILFSLIEKRKSFLKLTEELYSGSEEEIAGFFYSVFRTKVHAILTAKLEQVLAAVYKVNNAVLSKSPKCLLAVEAALYLSKIRPDSEFEVLHKYLTSLRETIITKTNCSIKKQGYLKDPEREMLQQEITLIEEYFRDISCFAIPEDHEQVEKELAVFGKALSKVFIDVLDLYSQKKKQNGYLDFEDILIKTREILKIENVSQKLREKYKYIMVDEYQDTNEIQFDIIMPILDYLNNGNLFVVGDEKQSIYMFRDAELAIFNKTKKDIAGVSGAEHILTLPDSFRMSPAICLFTNYVFGNLFKSPAEEYNEVRYTDIVCGREEGEPGSIEFILADKEKEQDEAELAAAKILELVNREENKLSFGDIAILCRKRRSFNELEKVLNKHNLPFTVLGGKGFYQQQIIYDIYNYLSFLLNNNNDAALAGLLRSPFFSISDAELFEISMMKGNTFWEKFSKYSRNNDQMQNYFKILNRNIYLARTLSFPELLRQILNESWFLSVIASRKSADQDLANIDKLISISISFSNQNFKTLYDFVSYLDTAINTQDDEGHAALTSEDNTIKIMTIHQAKGLEFKCVFLYNSHDTSQKDTAKAKDISLDKELGFLTALPHNNNFFEEYRNAPVLNLYNYIMKRKNIAEIKRLLYVAVTRAKNYLFVSASHKQFSFKAESFIALLMKGLGAEDLASENITIRDQLTFLKYTEDRGYENPVKEMELIIPIHKEVISDGAAEAELTRVNADDFIINIDRIEDSEEEEIISATKIAVFNQCPLKYQFTYEFGYLNLFKEYKGSLREYEFSPKEEENGNIADVKGTIVHSLLEKECSLNDLPAETELLVKKFADRTGDSSSRIKEVQETIIEQLSDFYKSNVFSELKSYSTYKNEFEIYCKENDYYLYGVIDKLIIQDKKAIIVDYKTDAIEPDEVEARINNYLAQLKFYAFLVSKYFPGIEQFTLRLVFIKQPDAPTALNFSKEEVIQFGNEIRSIVSNIRTKTFNKNLKHCHSCYYAVNNRCIK